MQIHLNVLAIVVAGIVVFMLGGLWYSPVLFATRWVALQGKTMEDMQAMRAGPAAYVQVFLAGLLTAFVIALVLAHIHFRVDQPVWHGALFGFILWAACAATSYGTAIFSYKPKALWMIDIGFNLVSMVVAGMIVGAWR
jgi:hypothetical protein